ncbi:MAG: hypothetical protein ACI8XQ_001862 [Bermanella sp.]|jgi:hypothetical protein
MSTNNRKLLTVITEAALESLLIKDIERLGVKGYTITDARGQGNRGVRNAAWDANGNIRIEVISDAGTVDTLADFLRDNYYDNYAMVLFKTDIEVIRPEKFQSL